MKDRLPIKFFAVGDLMLGDSPVCHGFGVNSAIMKHGAQHPFRHIADHVASADILFGNLEVVISAFDFARDPFASVQFRGQPESLEALAQCGFDVVSVCSNHTMQHGMAAFEEMIGLLGDRGIEAIGAEIPNKLDNYSLIEKSGWKVGFLGYNFRPQQYFVDPPAWKIPTREIVIEEVTAKRKDVDCLVLSLHWGDEFVDYPSPEQVRMAHDFVDAGADVIVGHHPHIVQGVEAYKGKVIAYSLGNFVFDMWQDYLRRTFIFEVDLREVDNMTYRVTPVIINGSHQPEIAKGRDADEILQHLSHISALISDDDSNMQAYRHAVDERTRRFRKEVRSFYLRNLYRYDMRRFAENFIGALRKRI